MSDGQWGGRREGSGNVPAPEGRADFELERAAHEKVKREQREFKLACDRAEYLPRDAQRQAAATALAVLTQSMRSVPDNLERICSLTPEQAELAQQMIDAALSEVALAFKAMGGDA